MKARIVYAAPEVNPEKIVRLEKLHTAYRSYVQVCIDKHKRDKTPRKVEDVSKLKVLEDANAVAEEWVTPTRLDHVLDKLGPDVGIERTREVIGAMIEDVIREGALEIVDSKEVRSAIGSKAAMLFVSTHRRKIISPDILFFFSPIHQIKSSTPTNRSHSYHYKRSHNIIKERHTTIG